MKNYKFHQKLKFSLKNEKLKNFTKKWNFLKKMKIDKFHKKLKFSHKNEKWQISQKREMMREPRIDTRTTNEWTPCEQMSDVQTRKQWHKRCANKETMREQEICLKNEKLQISPKIEIFSKKWKITKFHQKIKFS